MKSPATFRCFGITFGLVALSSLQGSSQGFISFPILHFLPTVSHEKWHKIGESPHYVQFLETASWGCCHQSTSSQTSGFLLITLEVLTHQIGGEPHKSSPKIDFLQSLISEFCPLARFSSSSTYTFDSPSSPPLCLFSSRLDTLPTS
jgi:hypothetical protein